MDIDILISRIDGLAKAKGWPRSEAFRRVGLNPVAVFDWRKGKSSPEKHLAKFADVLETTEAYLRGETDDRSAIGKHADGIEYIGQRARQLSPEQQAAFTTAMEAFLDALDAKNKSK